MTAKAGMQKHNRVEIKALMKESMQSNGTRTFKLLCMYCLTKKQMKEVINLLFLIKEKRDRAIKERSCTNSSKKYRHKTKVESALPTTSTNLVMLLIIVNVHENRDAVVVDVKGSYLLVKIDKVIALALRDEQVDIMCELDNKCKNYVTLERSRKAFFSY